MAHSSFVLLRWVGVIHCPVCVCRPCGIGRARELRADQPINDFLRQVAQLSGHYRVELARHPGLTFATTVSHINRAIRKLADVAVQQDYARPLYRAVRGELPTHFWMPDKLGYVCATDFGFMSTTRELPTALSYMSDSDANVLWEVLPKAPTIEAFHYGADGSSQGSSHAPSLYPKLPCPRLLARRRIIRPPLAPYRPGWHSCGVWQ